MLLQPACLLWDMDGTLIDSQNLHYESWHQAFQTIGVEITYSQFKETFGSNNHRVISSFLGYEPTPTSFDELSNLKESLFRELAPNHAQPFPGVLRWLQFFKDLGIPQGIASSAPSENIETIVKIFHLRSFFQVILSGINLPSKPDPAIFLKGAAELNCPPDLSVVLEDSIAGLQAGRAAGMVTVGLTSTYARNQLDADIIIEDFLAEPEAFHKHLCKVIARQSKMR